MTLLQIQYALSCFHTGSISKAAQENYTSVANLSKALKSLENELNYALFFRNHSGLIPTQKGEKFLEHAKIIAQQCEHMLTTANEDETAAKLSCACVNDPWVFDAFLELCGQFQHKKSLHLTLHQFSHTECIDQIIRRQYDIGIISIPPSEIQSHQEILLHNQIHMDTLAVLQMNLNLRKNHPALKDYTPGDTFDFTKLQSYPYVSYYPPSSNTATQLDFSHYRYFNLDAINPDKAISTNNISWKASIVSHTDAFSIGISGPKELVEHNNWVCIPLPQYTTSLCAIYSLEETLRPEASLLLSLIRKHLSM